MQPLPSRAGLAALSEAANAVVPAPLSGFARALNGDLVSILYSYPYGIGECRIAAAELPAALHATAGGPRDEECTALAAEPRTALDFMLAAEHAARLVSLPLDGADGRFWIAVPDAGPLAAEQIDRLARVAADAARLLTSAPPADQIHQRFARLERAAELVPSLLHVLDIREVFERLSIAAKRALPHDLLLLRLFSEDFATITVYARSDRGTAPPMVVPNTYPQAVSHAWTFDIVDDFRLHPKEKDTPPANGEPTPSKDRSGLVLEDGSLRITAIEVDHAPISPAYAYRFDYKGRSVVVTGDLKYHRALAKGAQGADVIVSEAISLPMTRSLGWGAKDGGRSQTAAIMHDIEDYHITPEQAARIANDAGARMLVFYHLLPAPDGYLMRQIFARGVKAVRPNGWAIADDGSLYTLPLGSGEIRVGRVRD